MYNRYISNHENYVPAQPEEPAPPERECGGHPYQYNQTAGKRQEQAGGFARFFSEERRTDGLGQLFCGDKFPGKLLESLGIKGVDSGDILLLLIVLLLLSESDDTDRFLTLGLMLLLGLGDQNKKSPEWDGHSGTE